MMIRALTLMLLLAAQQAGADMVTDWGQLIPPDADPKRIMQRHGVRFLDLSKPREKAIFDEIEAARREAPVVGELNGRAARLRGFVVPLDGDGEATTAFLLVPEYGYCIHVPPPPPNQLILVRAPDAKQAWGVFSEVDVTGTLRVEHRATDNGEAGYVIDASSIEKSL